jgi:hypothetical protein
MKVICINDKYKPESISNPHWIKKDEVYTVVKMIKNKLSNELFFVLEEIEPDDKLYGGYKATRFSLTPEEIQEFEENFGVQYTEGIVN